MPQTFDNKRDKELIATGSYFYCEGCLAARPLDNQSPDSRYCQGCYNFLAKEAEEVGTKKKAWVPKYAETAPAVETRATTTQDTAAKIKGDTIQDHTTLPPTNPPVIMSPLEDAGNGSHPVLPGAARKRGPKYRVLPDQMIKRLASEGKGSKAIASILKINGVKVSYKTIQRVLSGGRQLALLKNTAEKYC